MAREAAKLKHLKASIRAIQDPATEQYIACADESKPPKPAPLHLATLAPATDEGLRYLEQLCARRLSGVPHEIVRVDRA